MGILERIEEIEAEVCNKELYVHFEVEFSEFVLFHMKN